MFNLKKKIQRFKNSRKLLKLALFLHKIFGEKNVGEIGFNFDDKPKKNQIIQETIIRKKFQNYLEIGCYKNESFDFIECENKVGVDPYSGGTHRQTSDDYFKANKKNFDCIFIDGLHTYHQVKKDIYNSLNCLNENGVIFIHDCLPNNVYAQAVPRCQFNWNGTVWKAIVEFRTKEEFDTYTCYADQGIGIILKRKNRNKLDIKIDNFSKLKFSSFFKNYKEFMNIIEHQELKTLI